MNFKPTNLHDTYQIQLVKVGDQRGSFVRSFCVKEFKENGINFSPVQINRSYNKFKHTLRGMHFQKNPHAEAKIVQCLHGSIYDVLVDLRPNSPTYLLWQGLELSSNNYQALYVPAGLAHGFITLSDDSEIEYFMSEFFHPESASGIRWNDKKINIAWPFDPQIISDKDNTWPLLL